VEFQQMKALARSYVELSNAHQLEAILALFDEFAVYRSDLVGVFRGKKEIAEMMGSFFELHSDVAWEIGDFEPGPGGSIEFDFVMRTTDADTGAPLVRQGSERLSFTDAGLIRQVSVLARR
jgi:hypothetical protein